MLGQLEAGASVATAQTAFVAAQAKELAETKQQLAAEKAKAAAAPVATAPKKIGVDPTPPSSGKPQAEEGGDPIAAWDSAIAELQAERKLTNAQATRELVISNPNLHASYIAAYTKVNGPKVQR